MPFADMQPVGGGDCPVHPRFRTARGLLPCVALRAQRGERAGQGVPRTVDVVGAHRTAFDTRGAHLALPVGRFGEDVGA